MDVFDVIQRSAVCVCLLGLFACGAETVETPAEPDGGTPGPIAVAAPEPEPVGPEYGSWDWALQGAWRTQMDRARDTDEQPLQVYEFFGVSPTDTVIEAWPGEGWHTAIIAPYLAAGGGSYIAAHPAPTALDGRVANSIQAYFDRFGDGRLFGQVRQGQLGPDTDLVAPEASADGALAFQVVHAWMALGVAEKAFADLHQALKPGGYLGVVEARAPAQGAQDPRAANGYVQEAYVLRLANEAGFELEQSSDLHANAADTADHPFGVWTLAPYRRSSPLGAEPDPAFDRASYDAIGAPDRMVLLFRKPD